MLFAIQLLIAHLWISSFALQGAATKDKLNYALGINCEGSSMCINQAKNKLVRKAIEATDYMNPNDLYYPGAKIICFKGKIWVFTRDFGICLYAQGYSVSPTGISVALIKAKLQQLLDHGCEACGSVPLAYTNDAESEGMLTMNYVQHRDGCKGICPPSVAYVPPDDLFAPETTGGTPFVEPTVPAPSPSSINVDQIITLQVSDLPTNASVISWRGLRLTKDASPNRAGSATSVFTTPATSGIVYSDQPYAPQTMSHVPAVATAQAIGGIKKHRRK